jgi:hypothetical protein
MKILAPLSSPIVTKGERILGALGALAAIGLALAHALTQL